MNEGKGSGGLLERLDELKKWQEVANRNIIALHDIITALKDNDCATGEITPFVSPPPGGYEVTFVRKGTVTIYNGIGGLSDRETRQIAAGRAADGEYYWTVEDKWLLDKDKKQIPVTDQNGIKGVKPQLRINEKTIKWEISYDDNVNWILLNASNSGPSSITPQVQENMKNNPGDAVFKKDGVDDSSLQNRRFTLVNGEVIEILKN
jgi:hypothetical protein